MFSVELRVELFNGAVLTCATKAVESSGCGVTPRESGLKAQAGSDQHGFTNSISLTPCQNNSSSVVAVCAVHVQNVVAAKSTCDVYLCSSHGKLDRDR